VICSPYDPDSAVSRTALQAGVIRRDHADQFGLTRAFARNQLRASRWTQWGAHVLLMQNSGPSRRQLMLIAVLDVGYPAALASHTALELAGFNSFANEADDIHIIIPRGARCYPFSGVRVHESRRVKSDFHIELAGLPCTDVARSAIDAAAWQPWPRFACALLAAVVQQRLCTAEELDGAMHHVGRIRHKAHLREAIRDIRGGSQALSEIDLIRICRRFGLQEPDRQVRRIDSHGRVRYLDAEWRLEMGGVWSWRWTALITSTCRAGRSTCVESVALSCAALMYSVQPRLRYGWSRLSSSPTFCAIGVPRVVSVSGRQSIHRR
jgi:hypothetical protein